MTITLYDCATAPSPRRARIPDPQQDIGTAAQVAEAGADQCLDIVEFGDAHIAASQSRAAASSSSA